MSKLKKLLIAATCCFMLVAGITALTVMGNAGVTTAYAADEPTGVDATIDSIHARAAYADFLVYVETNDVNWSSANGLVGEADGILIDGQPASATSGYFRFGETSQIAMTMSFNLFPEDRTVLVQIPAGTVFGEIKLNSELRFNVFGHNGATTTSEERTIYWDKDSGAQDNLSRYLIWLNTKGQVDTSDGALKAETNRILIDGKAVNVEYTCGGGNTEYAALVNYSYFGDGITSCSQITDEHEIVFPKGLAIGNITLKEEFKAYVYLDHVKGEKILKDIALTGVEAAQRASDWLVRFTTDTALEGDAFSLSYGSVALTVGETKTEGWAYVCENGGVALTIDFDNVPANYGGRVSVAANTISSGAIGGCIKITNNYSFILLNGTAHEDKTYTVEIKNGDTVLTSITYDVLDREAKLTALKAAINGLTPPEHYYYEVNLPETLPEENCSYQVTVKPIEYDVIIGDAAAVKVAYGEKLTKPESDPTKDMTVDKVYTFDGWYNGDKKWDFETDTVQGDTTLVARFNESAREYDVKFGEDATATKAAYGNKLTAPTEEPTKTKEGYNVTFDGWYNGDKKWDFANDTVTGNLTLVAKFNETAITYTAKLTLGDGTEKDISYTIDNRAEKLAEAKALLSENNAQYAYTNDLPIELPLENGKTYIETRTINEYDVKIGELATVKVAYGNKLTKPETDPTKDMTVDKVYTFDGWYNGETKWNFDVDTVKGDVTLVAKFTETARKYTVTITFVGLEKDEVTLQVEYNGTVDFSAYAEDGYNMTIKNGETEITELTVTGDVNITITYAKKPAAAKKGCGGSVGGLGVMLTALGFAAVVFKKKRG
ncbi:MAG: InlB B-repeat-containing protein [Candidatus Borkfalkiaceae bacterium]|nr:InlB B-repeat-containing protein [Christensenellaceae bacterium]